MRGRQQRATVSNMPGQRHLEAARRGWHGKGKVLGGTRDIHTTHACLIARTIAARCSTQHRQQPAAGGPHSRGHGRPQRRDRSRGPARPHLVQRRRLQLLHATNQRRGRGCGPGLGRLGRRARSEPPWHSQLPAFRLRLERCLGKQGRAQPTTGSNEQGRAQPTTGSKTYRPRPKSWRADALVPEEARRDWAPARSLHRQARPPRRRRARRVRQPRLEQAPPRCTSRCTRYRR